MSIQCHSIQSKDVNQCQELDKNISTFQVTDNLNVDNRVITVI